MNRPPRRRRWLRWSLAGVGVLLIVLVGAVSAVTVTTTAPTPLTLPSSGGASPAAASDPAALAGIWNAGPRSVVGWRARQVLIGEQSTLFGRTGRVWGSVSIASGSVTQGGFTVDMRALTSTLSQSSQVSAFDITAFPTARLQLMSPIAVGTIPAQGVVDHFPVSASLTLRGITHRVRFTLSAELRRGNLLVLADIPLPFADWGISLGGVPFLADIQSPATIEVLLDLTHISGNPASVTEAGTSNNGAPR